MPIFLAIFVFVFCLSLYGAAQDKPRFKHIHIDYLIDDANGSPALALHDDRFCHRANRHKCGSPLDELWEKEASLK